MDRHALRHFARRDRSAVATSKTSQWRALKTGRCVADVLAIADRLRAVVPFIRPEDLIVTKLLAGREKDIDDVRGVLAERGAALDLSRIRTTLDLLEKALE